jgi:hypothetical protein
MVFQTPLAVGAYARFMVEAFDERNKIGVPTGFQSFFGRPETGGSTYFSPDSQVVDIDILRGNERTAMLILRGTNARPISGQKNTNEQKYSSFSRTYPLVEEEGDISADQLNRRLVGENPYQSMTKLDRLRQLALNQHNEQIRRIVRLFERLSAEAILTGKHPAILGTTNTDLIYDFLRNPENTEAVGVGWNQSGAVILEDIDKICETGRKNGHVNFDMAVIGGDAMDAFLKDENVQLQADNRRFELIEVSMNNPVPPRFARFVEGGFMPRGRLRTPKGYEIWLFTYTDIYTDSAGDAVKYMPEDQALFAYSGARCDRYFGPSELLPMAASRAAWYQETFGFNPAMPPIPPKIDGAAGVINPAMFYCDAYPGASQKTLTCRTQTAPIFVPVMTDGFGLLTDLIT